MILRLTSLPGRDTALYYGAGPAPYVNITDDDDMPIPAFGPIALDPLAEQNATTGNAAPSPAKPAARTKPASAALAAREYRQDQEREEGAATVDLMSTSSAR